jgi:hypothetical protein
LSYGVKQSGGVNYPDLPELVANPDKYYIKNTALAPSPIFCYNNQNDLKGVNLEPLSQSREAGKGK